MKLEEIIEKLENGTLTVNLMGHKIWTPVSNDRFGECEPYNLLKVLKTYETAERFDAYADAIKLMADDKFAKGEIDETQYKSYLDDADGFNVYECSVGDEKLRIRKNIEIGQCFVSDPILMTSFYSYCSVCGQYVYPYLYSENEIRFCHYNDNALENRCKGEHLGVKKYMEAFINVTEKLGFANFFREERLDQPDPKEFYNINHKTERYRLMQDCAKENIGYCQCDDLSCYIYVSKGKDEIVITARYSNALEKKQYKCYGHIGFNVWSYRFADTAKIRQIMPDYDELFNSGDTEKIGPDYFEVDVKPGKYRIRHYDQCPSHGIWTKIKKCK